MLCKLEICRYQDFFQPGGKVLPIESSLQIIQKWNVMDHCPDRIHVQSGHHPDDCGIAVRILSRHEVIVIVDLPPCLLDGRGGKAVNAGVQFLRVFRIWTSRIRLVLTRLARVRRMGRLVDDILHIHNLALENIGSTGLAHVFLLGGGKVNFLILEHDIRISLLSNQNCQCNLRISLNESCKTVDLL